MIAILNQGGFVVGALIRAAMGSRVEERSRADLAMEQYANGDRAAGGQLYELLRPRIYAIGLQWTRSASAAEDLVQDTFVKVTEARGGFRSGAPVLPWAIRIARNLLTDGHRHASFERWVIEVSLRQESDELGGELPADEALHQRRREAALREDLARLPVAHREAFLVIHDEMLPVKQAARRLGVTPGMIKIRTFRAVAALRAADARRQG